MKTLIQNNILSSIITLLLCTCLSACSESPVLPEVKPLTVTPKKLSAIPGITKGDLMIEVNRDIKMISDTLSHEIELSVFYPLSGNNYPIIFFSHGNWSSKDKYDNVINHWVSHGYVVIAPNHLDCCSMASGIFNSLRFGNFGLIEERVKDFNFLINNYDKIEKIVPALRSKGDIKNIALAGHSFGAFTAQQFGGAGSYNTDDESYHFYKDERVKAIIAISPPGPMFDEITTKSWTKLSTPTLVTTGTWDVDGHFFPQWQLHKMSFDTAMPNNKYALITQGADHYLGNLICRPEREQAPQPDALKILNATSTSFLNAYLKNDIQGKIFIDSNELSTLTKGFSTLERK